ncbi:MAG: hypothetical protein PHC68_09260 [Syntrophorhabdaceae bacterium]|nr:hypothetical protein [Syntrophorhabdaceae bacterium]
MAKTNKKPTRTTRISIDLSPKLYQRFLALVEKSERSQADVVRSAIVLLELAVDSLEAGKKFGVVDEKNHVVTEFIGL